MFDDALKTSEKARLRFKANYQKNKARYLEYSKKWWADHPEKLREKWRMRSRSPAGRAKAARHRARNLEKVRAQRLDWQRRAWAHRQEYMRAYYQKHKSKIKERVRNYWLADKDLARLWAEKRRAIKLNSTFDPKGILEFIKGVKSKLTFRCYYCRLEFLISDLHIDHVIPLARGGPHAVSNLCTACPECNLSKNDTLPSRWTKHRQLFLNL